MRNPCLYFRNISSKVCSNHKWHTQTSKPLQLINPFSLSLHCLNKLSYRRFYICSIAEEHMLWPMDPTRRQTSAEKMLKFGLFCLFFMHIKNIKWFWYFHRIQKEGILNIQFSVIFKSVWIYFTLVWWIEHNNGLILYVNKSF